MSRRTLLCAVIQKKIYKIIYKGVKLTKYDAKEYDCLQILLRLWEDMHRFYLGVIMSTMRIGFCEVVVNHFTTIIHLIDCKVVNSLFKKLVYLKEPKSYHF